MSDPERLDRIDLNNVWTHEALDCTPWLAKHVGALHSRVHPPIRPLDRDMAEVFA